MAANEPVRCTDPRDDLPNLIRSDEQLVTTNDESNRDCQLSCRCHRYLLICVCASWKVTRLGRQLYLPVTSVIGSPGWPSCRIWSFNGNGHASSVDVDVFLERRITFCGPLYTGHSCDRCMAWHRNTKSQLRMSLWT